MAKATVDVLVDDLDGSEAVETVRIGWNGDWRELDLSKKNLASLSKALDRYWNVSRPVSANGRSSRRRPNHDVVVALGEGEARSEADPGVGDRQRDLGTGARSHSRRRRAALQRGERPVVAAARRAARRPSDNTASTPSPGG